MKIKKRAQLSEAVYFNNEHSENVVHKGKAYFHSIPNIKIIGNILKPFYTFLNYPRPFNKIKTQEVKAPPTKSHHYEFQQLEMIRDCHFNRDVVASLLDEDRAFVPQSHTYRNQLLLNYDFDEFLKLSYIDEGELKTFQVELGEEVATQQSAPQTILMKDHTGIYELLQDRAGFNYIRHMYSVEVFKGVKWVQQFQAPEILQQILLKNGKLMYLSKCGLYQNGQLLWQQRSNAQLPYLIQSMHDHFNPFCLFMLSMAEIRIFDMRKRSPDLLVSKEMSEYTSNRFYSMHQFSDPKYIMVSTNQFLQFFDLRYTKNHLFQHHHNCAEVSIDHFEPVRRPQNYLSLDLEKREKQQQELEMQYPKDVVIGYSSIRNSDAIVVNFDSGVVESCFEPTLRFVANQLAGNNIQYCSKQQIENGLPFMLATPKVYNKFLKLRGVKALFAGGRMYCFSLDQQGGLGLQMFTRNFKPYQFDAQKQDEEYMSSFRISIHPKRECQPRLIDEFDCIFDEFNSNDLQLERIPDGRKVSKLSRRKKRIKFEDLELKSFHEEGSQEEQNFEDMIVMNNILEKAEGERKQNLSNPRFILTSQIIKELLQS